MPDHDLIQWLLESKIPTIRYLALRDLQERGKDDPQVTAAWKELHAIGPIPAILARQTERGDWADERSYYTPKYTSTHWSMLLLAELQADPNHPGGRKGADFMLRVAERKLLHWMEGKEHGLDCFWANMLRYTVHFGFADDPRLQRVVDYLVHDGVLAEWRCDINYEYPCAWGAGRAIWGLAALPERLRSGRVEQAIQSAVSLLIETNDLAQANYPSDERAKRSRHWDRLSIPLFYQADILLILRAFSELGRLDYPSLRPAMEWLVAQRKKNGRWHGSSPFRQRTYLELGGQEETDRWASLQAATILKKSRA